MLKFDKIKAKINETKEKIRKLKQENFTPEQIEYLKFWKGKSWWGSLLELLAVTVLFYASLFFGSKINTGIQIMFLGIDLVGILMRFLPLIILLIIIKKRNKSFEEGLRIIGLDKEKQGFSNFIFLILVIIALLMIFTSLIFENINIAHGAGIGLEINILKAIRTAILVFIVTIAQVALLEEIFFRGYFQNFTYHFTLAATKTPLVSSIISIGLAAVNFACAHFLSLINLSHVSPSAFNLRFINLILGGLFIGYIYNKDRNLWHAIFIHSAYNTLNFLRQLVLKLNFELIMSSFLNKLVHYNFPKELTDKIMAILDETIKGMPSK